jgi:hypothetical protein
MVRATGFILDRNTQKVYAEEKLKELVVDSTYLQESRWLNLQQTGVCAPAAQNAV